MFFIIAKFSFDPSKNVFGPFASEKEAWKYMNKMADEEYKTDIENGYDTKMEKDKTSGEITIENFKPWTETDKTEFFIIDVEDARK